MTLVYAEKFDSPDRARARERQLKGWTRAKKEALITGNRDGLKPLSHSGTRRLRGNVKRAEDLNDDRRSHPEPSG